MRNHRLKSIYDFYTSDLSYNELQKLIRKEAPNVLNFYLDAAKKPDNQNNLVRYFLFAKNIFLAFLFKLNPLRRLIYSIALFLFVWGFINAYWSWVFFSFITINILLAFEVAEKLTAKGELEIAKKIQEGLLPTSPPINKKLDISFFAETAREVGGDYLDFITNGEADKSFMFLGDISGKGMAAAIYMVQVRAIIHHLASKEDSIENILIELNKVLCNIFSKNYFFTANAALIKEETITFCRAGHLPTFFYQSSSKTCTRLVPSGIGLGLTSLDLFSTALKSHTLKLEPGDILTFISDGVTETMNQYNQEFGEEKLQKILMANSHKSSKEIQNSILINLNAFRGDNEPNDDISIIVIKAQESINSPLNIN